MIALILHISYGNASKTTLTLSEWNKTYGS